MTLYLKIHVMRSTIYVESFIAEKVHNFGGHTTILIKLIYRYIYNTIHSVT